MEKHQSEPDPEPANVSPSVEDAYSASRVAHWAHVWSEYLRREAMELNKSLLHPELIEPPHPDMESPLSETEPPHR